MMELAGDHRYSLLRDGGEPEKDALLEAFVSLFQRGFLKREGGRLVPSGEGTPFTRMRQAPAAVAVTAARGTDIMCYPDGSTLWITELSNSPGPPWYRLCRTALQDMERWLLEREILPPPVLTEEDAKEIQTRFQDESWEPSGNALAEFKRFQNGGKLLRTYGLFSGGDGHMILYGGARKSRRAGIYTAEALSRMLAECFGKDSYDDCECAGSRDREGL